MFVQLSPKPHVMELVCGTRWINRTSECVCVRVSSTPTLPNSLFNKEFEFYVTAFLCYIKWFCFPGFLLFWWDANSREIERKKIIFLFFFDAHVLSSLPLTLTWTCIISLLSAAGVRQHVSWHVLTLILHQQQRNKTIRPQFICCYMLACKRCFWLTLSSAVRPRKN